MHLSRVGHWLAINLMLWAALALTVQGPAHAAVLMNSPEAFVSHPAYGHSGTEEGDLSVHHHLQGQGPPGAGHDGHNAFKALDCLHGCMWFAIVPTLANAIPLEAPEFEAVTPLVPPGAMVPGVERPPQALTAS
jgi:hypothetical protein